MKVNFDIDAYKVRFLGGARQYLFYMLFTTPLMTSSIDPTMLNTLLSSYGFGSDRTLKNYMPYLVKSGSLPDSSIEEMSIPYPGHPFKMAGTRSYGDFQVTFNIDEQGILLADLNMWFDKIYNPIGQSPYSPMEYMRDQQLFLIDGSGNDIVKYTLHQAWPKQLGSVSLDYASTEIATIDVTFSYQYYTMLTYTPEKGTTDLLRSAFNKLTGSAMSIPKF